MAGTPIGTTQRYIPPGTREFVFVPAGGISNISSPTRAELEAGINLTAQVADYTGWALPADFVSTPDLGSRVVSQIPGTITLSDSTLVLYASRDSDDVRTVLPRDTTGFIVVMPEGDGPANGTPGTLMDVWPVTVASESDQGKSTDPAQRTVDFAMTAVPAINVDIPAAS